MRIKNEGIDIKVLDNSDVFCIFDGVVKKVFAIPGANMSVIIRHGHYLTVYSNIINLRVKAGENIRKNTVIGEVYNYTNNQESNIVHFRIYKENKTLNPEFWLLK
ncbi:MAG: M23 family metallopeptidase [Bacteroidales bacterium]|nr:M23 family metallopeptidase [Bacteroidales bacterium]